MGPLGVETLHLHFALPERLWLCARPVDSKVSNGKPTHDSKVSNGKPTHQQAVQVSQQTQVDAVVERQVGEDGPAGRG